MEILLLIVVWIAVVMVVGLIKKGAKATTKAAYQTVTGKGGSFSENLRDEWKGVGDFEVRLKDDFASDGSTKIKTIEARGLFPVGHDLSANVVITAFDCTGGEAAPIFTVWEPIQEETTVAFRSESHIGTIREGYGFGSWVPVGRLLPEVLIPPYRGTRDIQINVFLVRAHASPDSRFGIIDPRDPGLLWADSVRFQHTYSDAGYAEAAENRDLCRRHTIMIAMSVAMADGSLDDSEGYAIQKWIQKVVDSADDDERRESLKDLCNTALKDAHAAAKDGQLSVEQCTTALNEIGQTSAKYETIKLCYDVMAADGVADPSELELIRSIAKSLQLDFSEVEKMRDNAVLELSAPTSQQASIEQLLGIDPSWEKEKIRRHIENEFMKWNGRLSALTDPEKRSQAQRMIDLCGKAEQKYE